MIKKSRSNPIEINKSVLYKEYDVVCPNCQHNEIIKIDPGKPSNEIWYTCSNCKFDLQLLRKGYDIKQITIYYINGDREISDFQRNKKIIIKNGVQTIENIF